MNNQFDAQKYETVALKEGYLHRILVALDQLCNVILGGLPDETMSARSQRAAARGSRFGKFMVWWLNLIQGQHGQQAEAGDLARSETVEEIEEKDLGVKD